MITEKLHNLLLKHEYTSHKNKEMEPILPIQMKTLQNSTYKKDFDWLYFDHEPRAQENQQM